MPELTRQAAESAAFGSSFATEADMEAAEGITSAVLVGGTRLSVGNLLVSAVLVGVAVAVLSAGAVYVTRNDAPEA